MKHLKKTLLIYCLVLSHVTAQAQSKTISNAGSLEGGASCPAQKYTDKDFLELKDKCLSSIGQADSLIGKQATEIEQLKVFNGKLIGQIDDVSQQLKASENPPWYRRPTTLFLLGTLTGVLLYEKVHP